MPPSAIRHYHSQLIANAGLGTAEVGDLPIELSAAGAFSAALAQYAATKSRWKD